MSYKFQIKSDDAPEFRIELEVKSDEKLLLLVKDAAMKEKKGEDLLRALIEGAREDILSVKRFKDGRLNDSPTGEPAVQLFKSNGQLYWEGRYQKGNLNDGPNGEPAVSYYRAGGGYYAVSSFQDGKMVRKFTEDEISEYGMSKKINRAPKPPKP